MGDKDGKSDSSSESEKERSDSDHEEEKREKKEKEKQGGNLRRLWCRNSQSVVLSVVTDKLSVNDEISVYNGPKPI